MSFLRNLGGALADKNRLMAVLPKIVIFSVIAGGLLLIALSILPNWGALSEKVASLGAANSELMELTRYQEQVPQRLRKELSDAQKTLTEDLHLLLTRSEATEVLDKLYRYARLSGVEIVSLTQKEGPEIEKEAPYEIEKFGLQARGDLPRLMDLVSRTEKGVASPALLLGSVRIEKAKDSDIHTLTMDLTLYVSIPPEMASP